MHPRIVKNVGRCHHCPLRERRCAGVCVCIVDRVNLVSHAELNYCAHPDRPRFGDGKRPDEYEKLLVVLPDGKRQLPEPFVPEPDCADCRRKTILVPPGMPQPKVAEDAATDSAPSKFPLRPPIPKKGDCGCSGDRNRKADLLRQVRRKQKAL